MTKLRQIASLAALLLAASYSHAGPILFKTVQIPESVPNASVGIMSGTLSFDIDAHVLIVNVTFSGLTGLTTQSHVHCCTASSVQANPSLAVGVATALPSFPGFPLGVAAGSYSQTFDTTLASSWGAGFVTASGGIAGAEAAFLAGLLADRSYWNIHSSFATGGEIRAALVRVPEPGTLAMTVLGLLSLGLLRRRRGERRI